MKLPRRWRGGAGYAQMVADNLATPRGMPRNVVNPRMFDRTFPTSTRRRWSILLRVPMVRDRAVHPRPWEGPLVDWSGLFMSKLPESERWRIGEWTAEHGTHQVHDFQGTLAVLDQRIRENMERSSWPRIGVPVGATFVHEDQPDDEEP